jgi:hypothetical protein
MGKRVFMFAAVALLAAATPSTGGWAVTTVHDLPTHLVVGRATTFTFTVRQHGVEPVSGLSPTLLVKRADAGLLTRATRIAARPARSRGTYTVEFTPTEPGDVILTFDSQWPQKLELRPMRVIAADAPVVASAPEARGRELFVAAGCNTCHVKADDETLLDASDVIAIGPTLTSRSWPAEFIVKKVLEPATTMSVPGQRTQMPKLEVSSENAALIAAYLNSRQVATNR